MRDILVSVCSKFNIEGRCVDIKAISNGLINDSYWMEFIDNGENKQYVLQRINIHVFKYPEKVMQNIECVTEFIKNKCLQHKGHENCTYMEYFYTDNNKNYYIDEDGKYWRLSRYIKNSIVVDNTDDLDIIREIGTAFGKFQENLNDFPAGQLFETIPDFHNTQKRYEALKAALLNADPFRLKEARDSIDYLFSIEAQACRLTKLSDAKMIPLRVTHNDTKCNNVLLNEDTRKALCVIDLDTVMPGLVMHDFGDAARYICNTSSEDAKDLSRVGIHMQKFKALTEGFLSPIKNLITESELEYMAYGVFVMAAELATRFLTDYLNNDIYFKTNYAEHNLVRAKCQIALSKDIYNNLGKMNEIVYSRINPDMFQDVVLYSHTNNTFNSVYSDII